MKPEISAKLERRGDNDLVNNYWRDLLYTDARMLYGGIGVRKFHRVDLLGHKQLTGHRAIVLGSPPSGSWDPAIP
jgi:hypothetical protein